ncbi:MAG: hypothetical protein QXY24_01025 [Candidatus Aenigmatarchaeota archaeon]
MRDEVKSKILEILSNTQTPLTISSIKMLIFENFNRNFSWNTIQKYLNELVEESKIIPIHLPHSRLKGKTGLTVYILKR